MLTGVIAIAYDTSSNVTLFENNGGHGHLKFVSILVFMGFGALIGLLVGVTAPRRD